MCAQVDGSSASFHNIQEVRVLRASAQRNIRATPHTSESRFLFASACSCIVTPHTLLNCMWLCAAFRGAAG